ncbi:endonuclease/exonuclease/phosphatase family protein [Pseudodonghicola flavimaris]|uniref:Endonuclease/exonuclease/phosphatase family protein n=1 Tax=Pseudodonghicola flavimaris TaxID=3050036 RepID=A0ABT7F7A5_9RHOB|nr:endonuclease/exonuclease/phosphatase family protein [Pseudodonghicola flavimaris]MDK3020484.1 endonuclease/exonuclease/phosphatase family protein [Pseudodonghicola flavimaris]
MAILRRLGAVLVLAGALAVAAGYGGALHPALDAVAVFRVPLALATALVALALWRRPRAAVWAVVALMTLAAGPRLWALWGPLPAQAAPDFSLYQKNLMFSLADRAPVIADIRARRADVVTLQEVSRPNQAVLEALREVYPSQNYCDYRSNGGPAVLSRWPMVPGSATCGPGLAAIQIETPQGRLWAVSIHLRWPWPFEQPDQLALLEPVLRDLDGPKVIGGDFNNTAWSQAIARVSAASGTARVGREAVTFSLPFGGLGVGIDHVLSTAARGQITVLDRLGSDHRGLLAQLAI